MKKIRLLITMVFSILAFGFLQGQQNPWDIWLNPETDDFATIRQNAENYFSTIDTEQRGTGIKQYKRWEYMQQHRLTEDGRVQNYAARNFDEYHQYMASQSSRGVTVTYGYWDALGPSSWTDGNGWNGGLGRINCITFHPSNSSIFWVGSPSGGLWKTTNGGTTWTPLTDGMPRIGLSGMAVNYNNTNVMYLLTGDGDGADVYSIGVLKTIDGGVTWTSTGLTWAVTNFVRGYKLLMHPTNPAILFVVTNIGIFKTTNSGSSWTNVHSSAPSNYHDIEFKPGDPTTMYACAGTRFYRSTNTGDTWTQITSGVPSNATRIAIGVTPNNSAYVYLFAGPTYSSGTFVGMYRSFDSGLNFGTKSTTPNILGYSSTGNDDRHQTWYNHAVAISRTSTGTIVTGAINCWKSTDFGENWTLSSMWNDPPGTSYTHADIHALEINPLNNYLYCGSDGGIFRSTNFGDTWTDLSSGLAITQIYRMAGYQPNANLIIDGTQDNGSNKFTVGSQYLHVLGADGMDCMIDHSNSNVFYNSTQFGNLRKSTNGGSTYSFIAPVTDGGPWITPFIMNPSNSQIIYGGWYGGIRKSTNGGSTWTNIGSLGTGAMAHGVNNTSRIYASVKDSRTIYMSNDAGATFTTITGTLPSGVITFIAVNPDNSAQVYVTYGGYSSANKVFRSLDAGSTWTNITGSLPNIPVNCIAFQDTDGIPGGAIYIGTDVGVYYRDNDIGDWIPFMNGMPAVIVMDLEINYTSNVITAATYGRGYWRSELYSDCPPNYNLSQGNDPSNPNYTGFQHYEASTGVSSTRIITGGIGSDVTYQGGSYVLLSPGFHARAQNKFVARLGPCDGTAPIAQDGMNVVALTGTYIGPMLGE